jgi:hypothetical protein
MGWAKAGRENAERWVVVILVKCDSCIGRATDAHGWVLQTRDSLWGGVTGYMPYPSLDICVDVSIGTDRQVELGEGATGGAEGMGC